MAHANGTSVDEADDVEPRSVTRRPQANSQSDLFYDALRWREAARIVYFHTDHFEPWRNERGAEQFDRVEAFVEQANQLPYARKLTLFYNTSLPYNVTSELPHRLEYMHLLDGDDIGILGALPETTVLGQRMMKAVQDAGHEIQVHLHHERITKSSFLDNPKSKRIQKWLRQASSLEMDEKRFELYLSMSLDQIRLETGLRLERWAFVHGNWALNGSDPAVCGLTNEIMTLMRYGCFGDFTFPAPRKGVNPRIEEPFTIVPHAALRCYDTERAQPTAVRKRPNLLHDQSRFLIWSSPIEPRFASLDYYSQISRKTIYEIERMVLNWIQDSPKIGDTIYVKTHAHSLSMEYFENLARPVIPHMHPAIQRAFAALMTVCERANVRLDFLTVNEICEDLKGLDQAKIEVAFEHAISTNRAEIMTKIPIEPKLLNLAVSGALQVLIRRIDRKIETDLEVDSVLRRHATKESLLASNTILPFERLKLEICEDTPVIEVGSFGWLAMLFAGRGNLCCLLDESTKNTKLAEAIVSLIKGPMRERLRIFFRTGHLANADLRSLLPAGSATPVVIITTIERQAKTRKQIGRLCAALRSIPKVYINLRQFGLRRSTEAEFQQLIRVLASYGLVHEERVAENNVNLTISRFRNVAAADVPAKPTMTAKFETGLNRIAGLVTGGMKRPFR
jgi:hypothetical protein